MYKPPCVWHVMWSAEAKTKGGKRAAIMQFVLTSVIMERPMKKQTTQMTTRRSLRRWPTWKKAGYMSEIEVTRASRPTNWNTVSKQIVIFFSKILKVQKDMWNISSFLVSWTTRRIYLAERISHHTAGEPEIYGESPGHMFLVFIMWHDADDQVTWCLSLSRTGHTHRPKDF